MNKKQAPRLQERLKQKKYQYKNLKSLESLVNIENVEQTHKLKTVVVVVCRVVHGTSPTNDDDYHLINNDYNNTLLSLRQTILFAALFLRSRMMAVTRMKREQFASSTICAVREASTITTQT